AVKILSVFVGVKNIWKNDCTFVFSLEDIRIVAEFMDKEGGTFNDVYLSEKFNHRTRELEQRMQKTVEDAIDEGYSE
ncbi:MerR family transcriptional regulator, partial [Aggregatibacter actinomycetemcomitans]